MSVGEDSEKLWTYIKTKDLETTQLLLDEKADVKAISENEVNKVVWPREQFHRDSLSCLHYAAKKGRLQILEHILNQQSQNSKVDIDVNLASSILKWTPLHYAAHGGSYRTMKLLIMKGASMDAEAKDGKTPLHIALKRCSRKVIVALINCGAALNTPDQMGNTTLHVCLQTLSEMLCTQGECLEMIEFLLARKADPKIANKDGDLPLHFAVKYKVQKQTLRLICAALKRQTMICINAVNNMGYAPIHLCSSKEQIETLIEYGADLNLPYDNGKTVLHMNIGDLDIISFILEKGADEMALDNFDRTALHASVSLDRPNLEVVKLLASNSKVVQMKDTLGETVLHKACYKNYGKYKTIDDSNQSAKTLIIEKPLNPNQDPIVEHLVTVSGLIIDEQNRMGETALHIAVKRRSLYKANILLKNGADVDVYDDKMITPRKLNPNWARKALANFDLSDTESLMSGCVTNRTINAETSSLYSRDTATTCITARSASPVTNRKDNKNQHQESSRGLPKWVNEGSVKSPRVGCKQNNQSLNREVTMLQNEVKDMQQFLESFSKEGGESKNLTTNNTPLKTKNLNMDNKDLHLTREMTKLHDEVKDLNRMLQDVA